MSLDCIPAGMELFPAIDTEQFEFIKKVIDDCDYYILIVGGRYGSISEDGISFTEKEYDYAVSKNIPVLAFLHNDIKNLTFEKSETNEVGRKKLESFRDKVSKGRLVQFWNNADELNGKVAVSLMKTIKIYPAVGWVRANLQTSTESLQEINTLRKEIEQLKNDKIKLENKLNEKLSDIADLDETIEITGDISDKTSIYEFSISTKTWSHTFQWSEIFAAIALSFIEEKTDKQAHNEIGIILYELAYHDTDTHPYRSVNISKESFDVIKIQLIALELMDIYERGINLLWKLSKKGIKKMVELKAIKTAKKK